MRLLDRERQPGARHQPRSTGGEVNVLPITAASPAVDLIPTANCGAGQLDARGMYRPQGPRCDAGAYELDQAATVTINDGPSGTITTGDVLFDFQANEPGATVQCQLTGPGQTGGFATCYKSNAQPYSGLADGTYTFSVRAVTSSFPNPAPTTQTFTVDTTPPDTTITGGPTGPTNDTTPHLHVHVERGRSTFQCRSTARRSSACTSPYTAPPRPPARTRSRSGRSTPPAAGRRPPRGASRSTLTAPDTTINSGPSGTVRQHQRHVHLHLERGRVRRSSARSTAPRSGPARRATPASRRARTPSRSARSTPPATSTPRPRRRRGRSTPSRRTRPSQRRAEPDARTTPAPTFTFTSTEAGATFQCRVDGAAFAACPRRYTRADAGLAHLPGPRDRRRRQRGRHARRRRRSWSTRRARHARSTPAPTGATSDTTPTFDVHLAEAGATFAVPRRQRRVRRLHVAAHDGGARDGAHTFQVRAIDAAGNVERARHAHVHGRHDRAGHDDHQRPDRRRPTTPRRPSGFTSNEPRLDLPVPLDGAAFDRCPTPVHGGRSPRARTPSRCAPSTPPATPTARPRRARSRSTPTAPTTTITSGPPAAHQRHDADLRLHRGRRTRRSSAASTRAAFATCTSGYTPRSPPRGRTRSRCARRRRRQPAHATPGRSSPTPPRRTRPSPAARRRRATTRARSSPSPPPRPATFQCSLDGAAFTGCNSPHFTGTLAPVSTPTASASIDAAGNTDATPAAQTFVIDTVAERADDRERGRAGSTVTLSGKSEAGATVEIARGRRGRRLDQRRRQRRLDARARERSGRLAHLRRTGPGRRRQRQRGLRAAHRRRRHGPAARAGGAGTERSDQRPEPRVHVRLRGDDGGMPAGRAHRRRVLRRVRLAQDFSALAPGDYVFFVRVTEPSGLQAETRRPFTVTVPQVQAAQTPTPTPTRHPRRRRRRWRTRRSSSRPRRRARCS